jgi:hypothetical protein
MLATLWQKSLDRAKPALYRFRQSHADEYTLHFAYLGRRYHPAAALAEIEAT